MSRPVRPSKPVGISRGSGFSGVPAARMSKSGLSSEKDAASVFGETDSPVVKKRIVKTKDLDTLKRRKLALSRDQVKTKAPVKNEANTKVEPPAALEEKSKVRNARVTESPKNNDHTKKFNFRPAARGKREENAVPALSTAARASERAKLQGKTQNDENVAKLPPKAKTSATSSKPPSKPDGVTKGRDLSERLKVRLLLCSTHPIHCSALCSGSWKCERSSRDICRSCRS